MDIKEYIESGIIESYVLGSVSDQERREVECMSAIYPELKQYLHETQRSFESFAQSLAVSPPPQVKESLLQAIKNMPQDTPKESKAEAKIVSLAPKNQTSPTLKLAMAASLLLMLGTGALYIMQSRESASLKSELAGLQKEQQKLTEEEKTLQQNLAQSKRSQELMLATSTVSIALTGTPVSPESKVRVFYNPEKQEAVLSMDALPQPDQDKQYQLWALVDGKPIDLGVFDLDSASRIGNVIPVSMQNIQAFAITLEKKGGSPTPNLEQLYVIGNI